MAVLSPLRGIGRKAFGRLRRIVPGSRKDPSRVSQPLDIKSQFTGGVNSESILGIGYFPVNLIGYLSCGYQSATVSATDTFGEYGAHRWCFAVLRIWRSPVVLCRPARYLGGSFFPGSRYAGRQERRFHKKSDICVTRHPSSWRRTVSTPHSSGFASRISNMLRNRPFCYFLPFHQEKAGSFMDMAAKRV